MANGEKKEFKAPNSNTERESIPDAAAAPSVTVDLSGVETKVQKALLSLLERVTVLEAKTANMPIVRPVFLPREENSNTDYVAGM